MFENKVYELKEETARNVRLSSLVILFYMYNGDTWRKIAYGMLGNIIKILFHETLIFFN
jgi:hypothetical protein